MSVEMVRRLHEGGGVPRAEVELALLQAVIRGVSFVEAFVAARGGQASLMEQEVSRSGVPELRSVHARPELCALLPVGMCERLLAVPVRQESITKTVDVAAVDPYDSHLKQEFSFHLDVPVRILRAPMQTVIAALELLHTESKTADAGLLADSKQAASERPPSHPPIPLVRRPGHEPKPSVTGPAESEAFKAPELDDHGQPVIDLKRAKSEASAALTRSRLQQADLAQVEKQLALSKSPDEVVDLLGEHACPEGRAVVFSVKSSEFVARSASVEVAGLRDLSIPRSEPSVLLAALESGHYLGTLPQTLAHSRIRDLLALEINSEIYVAVVSVGERATLLVLIVDFERSFTATRRVDRLAAGAGAALERLVFERKRSRQS